MFNVDEQRALHGVEVGDVAELRLVGVDEDMSFYEGQGDGPDVAKVKESRAKDVEEIH